MASSLVARVVASVPGEYITAGRVYNFREEAGNVYYVNPVTEAGSWMAVDVWEAAVKSGKIIIEEGV